MGAQAPTPFEPARLQGGHAKFKLTVVNSTPPHSRRLRKHQGGSGACPRRSQKKTILIIKNNLSLFFKDSFFLFFYFVCFQWFTNVFQYWAHAVRTVENKIFCFSKNFLALAKKKGGGRGILAFWGMGARAPKGIARRGQCAPIPQNAKRWVVFGVRLHGARLFFINHPNPIIVVIACDNDK